ncbi:MAG: hypothetical protein JNJ46_31130 [Myxococcales bacterium]|nr:hypothetical protein [Myxococcales bacterium]
MTGSIDFLYDAANDIVIANLHWNIETEEDVKTWYRQYETYFEAHFNRRVDIIFVHNDFQIKTSIAVLWGEYRARLIKRYTGLSFRVHSSKRVLLFVQTSGVRYDVSTQEAASVEDAIEGIKAMRQRQIS